MASKRQHVVARKQDRCHLAEGAEAQDALILGLVQQPWQSCGIHYEDLFLSQPLTHFLKIHVFDLENPTGSTTSGSNRAWKGPKGIEILKIGLKHVTVAPFGAIFIPS